MIDFEKLEDVLCFTISEKITDEDYKTTLIPETEKEINEFLEQGRLKRLKIAIILDEEFEGATFHAVIDDLIYGIKHRKELHKIGITGKHFKNDERLIKFANKFISGKVNFFEDKREMLEWLK